MKTFLRFQDECLEQATHYDSRGHAMLAFECSARELDRYPSRLKDIELLRESREKAWAVAKSLQAQLKIATDALTEIAANGRAYSNDGEHDALNECTATAQAALHQLKELT